MSKTPNILKTQMTMMFYPREMELHAPIRGYQFEPRRRPRADKREEREPEETDRIGNKLVCRILPSDLTSAYSLRLSMLTGPKSLLIIIQP
jgi:hypothetical protein